MIRAMVPTETPATETAEIMFIAFRDFFAKRYLFAMYRESFTFYLFAVTRSPVPVLCIMWISKMFRMKAKGYTIR